MSEDLAARRAHLSAERRALLDRLRGAVAPERREGIPRRAGTGPAPLSSAQQRLWFLDRLLPGNPAYNVPYTVRLSGPLEPAVLGAALSEILRRHEVLRTAFREGEAGPVQEVAPHVPLPLPVVDLAGLPAAVREPAARALAAGEVRRPFDLGRPPLLRASLLRSGPSEHVLVVVLHHIVSDGWSLAVLGEEMAALYGAFSTGRPSPLPELELQYADYAAWQRQWLESEGLRASLATWRERLAGAPAVLSLPTDRPRPPVQGVAGGVTTALWSARETAALEALGQRQQATLYMTLLAGFAALLARSSGQQDLVIGSVVANRGRRELEPLIGFFVNSVALRLDLADDPPFLGLLAQARQRTIEMQAHQEVPFERLVEELAPERHAAHTPLFQVLCVLQSTPAQEIRLPGLTLSALVVETATAQFDLVLSASREAGGLRVVVQYRTDLFERATARRLLWHLRTLLAAAVADPGLRVSELPLLGPAEAHQVLCEWGADLPVPEIDLVHRLVAAQAERTPDAPAVLSASESLTYGELATRVRRLARRLAAAGVGPEVLVALAVERSPAWIVALLAVLEAGGAYLPLDPAHPAERLELMLRRSGAAFLVGSAVAMARIPETSLPRLAVDRLESDGPDGDQGFAGPAVDGESLAYVIFTSGSTGTPRAVMVRHRALGLRIGAMVPVYGFGPGQRLLQFVSPSFDAAAEEIYPTLASGAALVVSGDPAALAPSELLRECERSGVTALHIPPAYWYPLLDELEATGRPVPSWIRLFITGGESPSVDRLAAWRRRSETAGRFVSAYGPTEATITTLVYDVPADPQLVAALPRIPLGRPLPGAPSYILDATLRPVPIGVHGELYTGGDGLARGYLGLPELTAERFVPDPFSSEPGGRLYRTGDLARFLPDGTFEFLGRADQQVKIRGHRVEPGEVRTVLERHPVVREAVVTTRTSGTEGLCLAAYFVPAAETVDVAELRAFAAARLPSYMVPTAWRRLEGFPLTPAGKVDLRALPSPEDPRAPAADDASPRTELERRLADLWREVLGVERVGLHDNFFELGGHSVALLQVHSRLRSSVGEVPLVELFNHTTVAALAAYLGRKGGRPPAEETDADAVRRVAGARDRLALQRARLGTGAAARERKGERA